MSRIESTAAPLRAAVIGVGYLGRFHAQKYAAAPGCLLVGVVDANLDTAARVGNELGVPGHDDFRRLLGQVDAVSIAVPTPLHFEVASAFLDQGCMSWSKSRSRRRWRKPVRSSSWRPHASVYCKSDIWSASIPPFWPRWPPLAGRDSWGSHRLAPFKQRGTDVSVVLDLMIHDIDLIQTLVGAPIDSIDAVGTSVFSGDLDIANARIRFVGGCVANTTASRVSLKQERKLRIFQDDAYFSIDLQQKILTIIRKKDAATPVESAAQVAIEEQSFDQGDALNEEIEAFLRAIREGTAPVVSGEDGLRALDTAIRIAKLVHAGNAPA